MKTPAFLFLACAAAALVASSVHAQSPEPSIVLKLWAGKPPGDFTVPGPETITPPKPTDKAPILRITNIAEPRLELYEPAADKKNGEAVIIVPGGGFGILASGHEGSELAEWFRARADSSPACSSTAVPPTNSRSHGNSPRRTHNEQ